MNENSFGQPTNKKTKISKSKKKTAKIPKKSPSKNLSKGKTIKKYPSEKKVEQRQGKIKG